MPCYEVRTISCEFKAANADLLKKALDGLGWSRIVNGDLWTVGPPRTSISLNLELGRATIKAGQQSKLNELKRAYSMEAVRLVAVQNHCGVSKLSDTKGKFTKQYC